MKKETNLFDMIGSLPAASNRQSLPKITRVSLKDIAIIGMAVRFPLADNIGQFWYNLRKGVDCIRRIPEQRKKDAEDYSHFIKKEPATVVNNYEKAAYLDAIDGFDYRFFRLSPKEASLMDPNQRLFLQTAWTAMEDAGYGGERLVGTRTGVYVGFGGDSQYKKIIADVEPSSLSLAVPGNLPPIIASRLSYLMDFRGPSMLVNTVCSSSLLAVHLACQGIRNRECDFAIAGGVQTYVLPIRQTRVGVESSDFKTKTFDHSSDGTGSGEGVAAVLLKSLHKALKDRDHIYAVIKGGAVNQDGRSIGISAPNPAAQEDVITRAWKDADIDPETISYIEAHGTGTQLGDPIEVEGITRAFARYTEKKQFCAIGSVKSNMGHLDNSAGIAGLIKAVLALKNKEIPPTLHFNRPNRKIPFHRSPVYVNDTLTPWETNGFPRRCGVSSFSFSGTNCHLILEEAPEPGDKEEPIEKNPGILTLSAKTREGLKTLVKEYKRLNMQKGIHLKDLCFTANTGRGHYSHRLALVLRDEQDFTGKIANLDIDHWHDNHNGVYYGVHQTAPPGKEITGGENGEITRENLSLISKTANETLRSLINDRDNEALLHQVGELYIKGAEIHWDELYCGSKPGRMSLPTYPFQAHRCWLQFPALADENKYYYTTGWRQEELPEKPTGTKQDKGIILILKDQRGIGEQIAARFREQGEQVVVEEGEDYEKILAGPGMEKIRQIIHLQAIRGDKDIHSPEQLEEQLKRGVYSLFYLAKVLSARKMANIDIVLVSDYAHDVNHGEPVIHPGNAAFFGLGKVVNVENVNLKCRAIDIDSQTSVDCILREINAGYTTYKVAYRRGSRYIEEMEVLDITAIPGKNLTIKQKGVYIITGGTGGLGLEIAGYFASKNKVNLALIQRTPIPHRSEWDQVMESEKYPGLAHKISLIREIEKKGTRVLCCCADAANELEIKYVIADLRKKFGKINGIVHCAGVGSGRQGKRLEEDSENIFREVMAPKVWGTWLLDRLTRDHPPDFFVVFSSPITLMGGIGSGSYTAANSYLDSFASYRNRSNQKSTTMSWAPWQETIKKMDTRFDSNRHLFNVLSTKEIINAFDRVLSKELPLVIIGKINYKSEIFYMGDRLPFRLSGDMANRLKEFQKKSEWEFNRNISSEKEQIRVQLTGRDNKQYSEFECQVAQNFGKFLGYKELSIYDNFYELGGDSIIAVKIIQAINRQMQLDVKPEELLKYPTIKEFSRILDKINMLQGGKDMAYAPILPVEEKEYYPLSSAQKRMYLLHLMNRGNTAYNITLAYRFAGHIQLEKLQTIFRGLIERHESFRTSFYLVNRVPVQKIYHDLDFEINYYDISEVEPKVESNEGIWRLTPFSIHETSDSRQVTGIINNFVVPFDLSQAPLLRAAWIKYSQERIEEEYLLIVDMHHIISDGTSMGLLIKDFMALYEGEILSVPKIRYRDYVQWQNDLIRSGAIKSQEKYWQEELAGEIPVLMLPTDFTRPKIQNSSGNTIRFVVDQEKTAVLREIARAEDTTLFMVLLAFFKVLLAKISCQEEIVVGIPAAGRRHADLKHIIGMFLHTLILRSYPVGEKKFIEFLKEVKNITLKAFDNQDYPFENLVEKLVTKRDPTRNPLFDVMFIFQNWELPDIKIGGLNIKPYTYEKQASMVDLTLIGTEVDNHLSFMFEYCTKLFKKESIIRIVEIFSKFLDQVVRNVNTRIKELGIEESRVTPWEALFNQVEFNTGKIVHPVVEAEPVMLPDETFANGEGNTRANEVKEKVKQGYTRVDEALRANRLEAFATFLNMGYVPNENKQYAAFEVDKSSLNKNSVKLLLEVIGNCDLDGKKLAEIGCGRGGNIAAANDYFVPTLTVGLDICAANIKFCHTNYSLANVNFCIGDAENMPFPNNFFDALLNIESSDAYPDIHKFFREVFRVLKNGGYFLYTDLLPAEKFNDYEYYLKDIGFSIARNQDITLNVLLSSDEIAGKRRKAYKKNGEKQVLNGLEDFLAVPGSPVYEKMRKGIQVYKIFTLVKA